LEDTEKFAFPKKKKLACVCFKYYVLFWHKTMWTTWTANLPSLYLPVEMEGRKKKKGFWLSKVDSEKKKQ